MSDELKTSGEFQYKEGGEGHPIVVLHGLFGALSNFTETFDHFSTNYRVIIPVLPLYDLPILSTNVGELAKFLDKFLKHMKLKKVSLLGNSLGGHVALVYCQKHLSNVHSLILSGSSGLYENAFGGSFPRRDDKEFLRKKIEITFFDPKFATDELVDECYDTVNDKGRLIRILSLARSAIKHNMADDLPNFDVPTCLIWGKNDQITPPHVAEVFDELLPNSELFWIDKCGHAPMMEQPEEFNKLLDVWLSKTIS